MSSTPSPRACRAPQPRWIEPPGPPADRRRMEVHPVVDALLGARGIDDEARADFFRPRLNSLTDPFALPGMEAAVGRLLTALDHGERVVLYGDYDVDGITSLAQVFELLAAFGQPPAVFLPHRLEEGYGLSQEGLERCLAEHDPQLLIALDCGTVSVEPIAWLAQRGIDTIVVDHHQPGPVAPACAALVNPQLGHDPQARDLCTAGLAFKLSHALLKKRQPTDFDLRASLDLVALGTVADICPLRGENRLFVRHGLHQLGRTIRPGLRALMDACGIRASPTAADLGFRLGPRLNAAGRLDSATDAYELLITTDPERARELAGLLDERNRRRQQVQAEVLASAEAQIETLGADPPALILGARDWHPGVVGIVAGRLARRYHRPTFVIGFDEGGLGKGSGRSVAGVSLVEGIEASRKTLVAGGGHAAAAGVTVREECFEDFRQHFLTWLAETGLDRPVAPELRPDLELPLALCDEELLGQWKGLEPFGEGFPQPLFLVRACQPLAEPRWLKERHLKLSLAGADGPLDALWFHACDELDHLPAPPWDLVAELSINEYRGRQSLQLFVRALRASR